MFLILYRFNKIYIVIFLIDNEDNKHCFIRLSDSESGSDFKLDNFTAGPSECFDAHYGENGYSGDGDVTKPENLEAFSQYVKDNTDGAGVHFAMADGVRYYTNVTKIFAMHAHAFSTFCISEKAFLEEKALVLFFCIVTSVKRKISKVIWISAIIISRAYLWKVRRTFRKS